VSDKIDITTSATEVAPTSSAPIPTSEPNGFKKLGLDPRLLAKLVELNYKTPTPIQVKTIPPLIEGRDLIGQAQTGTGKTAAFALPMLHRIDPKKRAVQALILAPTRELALQVAEAVKTYSAKLGKVRIAAVYGGQAIMPQIKQVKAGAQIIVGTPGRVMDLMRRGTIKLGELDLLVLDEADEMLRMGFIDDVEWILGHTPDSRQLALFSATMPREIELISDRYTKNPARISVARKELTLPNIAQSYWLVKGLHKLDALTRILETETIEAGIIFVRTKAGCADLATQLSGRGFSIEALNGDMSQSAREQAVRRMKAGKIDLIVATDVAARGLDIDRISHVFNFDIPMDVESYVHRIGRTGRAGNEGIAILFVTNKERWMLKKIERFTNSPIPSLELPSYGKVIEKRVRVLKERLYKSIEDTNLDPYNKVVLEMLEDDRFDLPTLAAAAIRLAQGDQSLEMKAKSKLPKYDRDADDRSPRPKRKGPYKGRKPYSKSSSNDDDKPGNFKKKGYSKKKGAKSGFKKRAKSKRAGARSDGAPHAQRAESKA
jgi:ATP-dependent RNA helicase DeaD